MAYTFKDLKLEVRSRVFPTGEAYNLRVPHDKMMVDAMVLIQDINCWQEDNTKVIPHCSTNYKCGLTSFDFGRARINKLSVIDRINPTTHLEDATAEIDWCSEITYRQVDQCYMDAYYARSRRAGCCLPLSQFFAIPYPLCGNKSSFPVPTDEGIPEGLPILPLGYHYPQESTNSKCGRAKAGVWAIDRGGRILVGPWIQSTEYVIVYFDGKKLEWGDADLVDKDPELIKNVVDYVRAETKKIYNDIPGVLVDFQSDYAVSYAQLIHSCREETRIRGCEPSFARGLAGNISTLFYNDAQQYTATCAPNQTGDAKTVTIPADTFGSAISKADANQQALQEAQRQAQALLVCVDIPVTYWNVAQSATATCTQADGAPAPDGAPSTVTVPANTHSSIVSQAAADAAALADAETQAAAALTCTFWNSEASFTASCPEGSTGIDVTETVAAHTVSSTVSQAAADAAALLQATNAANEAITCTDIEPFWNVAGFQQVLRHCTDRFGTPCIVQVRCDFLAHHFSSLISQADANTKAYNAALQLANANADLRCENHVCGPFNISI